MTRDARAVDTAARPAVYAHIVRSSSVDGVERIALDRPEKKNAINTDVWRELESALDEVARNQNARVLILEATGSDFCVGADLDTAANGRPAPPSHRRQLERMQWINSIVSTLHGLRIPTIARVDGLAVGIGMNLALCCDFVVASTRARFSEIFIRRALTVDGGGSWLLPRLIGLHRAKQLCLLGEMISAGEASDLGLVTTITAPEHLSQAVDELAARLCGFSPSALAHMKSLLDSSFESSFLQSLENEARTQALNIAGDDFKNAMAAFATRPAKARKPTREDNDE